MDDLFVVSVCQKRAYGFPNINLNARNVRPSRPSTRIRVTAVLREKSTHRLRAFHVKNRIFTRYPHKVLAARLYAAAYMCNEIY